MTPYSGVAMDKSFQLSRPPLLHVKMGPTALGCSFWHDPVSIMRSNSQVMDRKAMKRKAGAGRGKRDSSSCAVDLTRDYPLLKRGQYDTGSGMERLGSDPGSDIC